MFQGTDDRTPVCSRHPFSRGFSLVELLVALALGLLIMGSVMELFRQGVNTSSVSSQRAEMQQNARVALNLISQDLSVAGTGFPQGGIQLPTGDGSTRPKRGCLAGSCGAWNFMSDDRLYAVTPGDGSGTTIGGTATDIVTLVYRDETLPIGQAPLISITASGDQINAPTGASSGIVAGDLLMLCNANGCAVGTVTSVDVNDRINLADGDSLSLNQTAAASGKISSIANSGLPAGVYPPTTAYRILVITYSIEPGTLRLMRQVNAHPPVPVAEVIEDLQVTYDTFDEATGAATSNLPAAGGVPNQIRKINISVNVRSPGKNMHNGEYDRFSLRTSVSGRNLTFRDRYL